MQPRLHFGSNIAQPASGNVFVDATMTIRPHYLRITFTVAAVVAGATLFVSGYWVGSAGGSTTRPVVSHSQTVPDWFLDIADYYDRNPAVSPGFNFALLYDSTTRAHVIRRDVARSISRERRGLAHK